LTSNAQVRSGWFTDHDMRLLHIDVLRGILSASFALDQIEEESKVSKRVPVNYLSILMNMTAVFHGNRFTDFPSMKFTEMKSNKSLTISTNNIGVMTIADLYTTAAFEDN
jgi:hypothetical protein